MDRRVFLAGVPSLLFGCNGDELASGGLEIKFGAKPYKLQASATHYQHQATPSTRIGGTPSTLSLTHNQAFTITGSGFGTKSRGLAPILDDHGQAGVVSTGTGNIDPQWHGRQAPGTSPTYDAFAMRNRSVGFAPSGATIGAPNPFVSAIIAGSHYSDSGGWAQFITCSFTIPTLPCVLYARWYERQDPNSFVAVEDHGGGKTGNNKSGSYDMSPTILTKATMIMQFATSDTNWTNPTHQMTMSGDDFSAQGYPNGIQIPDNNGHRDFWGATPNPYNSGWVLKEWEICIDQTYGGASNGYNRYSACANGTVYPVLGNVGTIQAATSTGSGNGYAGGTDVNLGLGNTRYLTLGNGEYLEDYSHAAPGAPAGAPAPPADQYNYVYLADVRIDLTGASVAGNVARVILGNQPTLATSSIRAYCNVSAWSGSSITATAWKDQFTTGQTAYVHVVTEAGTTINNVIQGVWS